MLEVADIFRQAGGAYRCKFAERMLPSHTRAMRDIEQCRTAALGGHLRRCERCGKEQYSYHSCRNRHCPKCHTHQTRRWLKAQRSRLLSCSYFLVTFTLPEPLRPLARTHQKTIYAILMRCAAQALIKLAQDPRYLGARPGLMGVLHTWTRTMLYHPHAHFLVTGGGLAPEGDRWLKTKNPQFLVPGRALSVIFRAKVKDALAKAGLLGEAPAKAWRRKWVVHCQHAGSGEKVLEYLARYVFRIAISNSRLESLDDGQVTFRYRESQTGQMRRCTLSGEAFITRFLQHVLPSRFTKVRYYGIYSPSSKGRLERARALLDNQPTPLCLSEPSIESSSDDPKDADPNPPCPFCRVGRMQVIETLPRQRDPP